MHTNCCLSQEPQSLSNSASSLIISPAEYSKVTEKLLNYLLQKLVQFSISTGDAPQLTAHAEAPGTLLTHAYDVMHVNTNYGLFIQGVSPSSDLENREITDDRCCF